MTKIAVVTVARSDYGILRPLLARLHASPLCSLFLIVGGTHFDPAHGNTVREIESDHFPIAAKVHDAANEKNLAHRYARALLGMQDAFAQTQPDIVVVLGDRFEMFAAATAAVLTRRPLAHIHGGELTTGSMDDVFRHSISKMSHLHFASTDVYAQRIEQLGEEPWRVHVSGALALDNLLTMPLLSTDALQADLGFSFVGRPILLTLHPPTLETMSIDSVVTDLLALLKPFRQTVIITAPNADLGGPELREKLQSQTAREPLFHFVESLGTQRYFSLMQCASAMVGNSSSGIIEAASFRLPVVNLGHRQTGRLRAANVIDSGFAKAEMQAALDRALSDDFRASLDDFVNPYGDGHAADRIAEVLLNTPIDETLITKKFNDWPNQPAAA